jgi:hypothetical protein
LDITGEREEINSNNQQTRFKRKRSMHSFFAVSILYGKAEINYIKDRGDEKKL